MPTNTRSTLPLLPALTALAVFGISAGLSAQTPDPASGSYMQSQPAPIQRAPSASASDSTSTTYPNTYPNGHPTANAGTQAGSPAPPPIKTSQPASGVYVRVSPQGSVTTVANTADRVELRVDSGVANISVHHPEENTLILVDLGGGQLDLLKDGMYTFNATTKTARVLVGEADAFTSTDDATGNSHPIKVKEDRSVTFGAPQLRPVEFQPMDARADVLPVPRNNYGDGQAAVSYPAYGFYAGAYPYFGWDDPYFGWGYPGWGWGYPFGLGLGFYGGGFYGGGFRGRGFGGGGFGGRGFGGGGFGGRGGFSGGGGGRR